MANINLLPWREERRKDQNQEFGVLMGIAALVGLAIFAGLWKFYGERIENQDERNQILTQEIAVLDRRIKRIEELEQTRAELLARKNVIESLQKSRTEVVHLFKELVRTIPDGVRMQRLAQQGNRVTLNGVAESNAKVSAYMDSLEASEWLRNTDLTITEERDEDTGTERYDFSLSVLVGQSKPEDEEGLGDEEGAL